MKKIGLLGITALAALSLAACSSTSGTNNTSKSSESTTKQASSSEKKVASSSEKPKSGWTQEIYDSIKAAKANYNADASVTYSGGTPYAEIEAKVGKPTSSSETSIGNQTTVVANWTSISWTKGDSSSVTLSYDKQSGQITNKSKFSS